MDTKLSLSICLNQVANIGNGYGFGKTLDAYPNKLNDATFEQSLILYEDRLGPSEVIVSKCCSRDDSNHTKFREFLTLLSWRHARCLYIEEWKVLEDMGNSQSIWHNDKCLWNVLVLNESKRHWFPCQNLETCSNLV